MKHIRNILLTLAASFYVLSSQAVSIVANEYIALENVSIEILHNTEKNKGSVIVRQPGCSTCKPMTLRYEGLPEYSVNGYLSSFAADSLTIGRGDISYKEEDMSLGHINMYQQ